MKKLNKHIRKNGFDYEFVKRGKKSFIYKQHITNWKGERCADAYEVFKRKVIPESVVFGNAVEEHEHFPKDSDFGISAWSYRDFSEACDKFEELENN